MKRQDDLWKCLECDTITGQPDKAPNPFAPHIECTGCPSCAAINSFEQVCDERGCHKVAHCGWLSEDGYRRTCYVHMKDGDEAEMLDV